LDEALKDIVRQIEEVSEEDHTGGIGESEIARNIDRFIVSS